MVEFALFIATIAGAFWMAHSLVNHASRPKMKAQPIKIEEQKKRPVRRNDRFPY